MGKLSKGAALRAVDPNVMEFVEAASMGDVRTVKKLVKAAKVEIDEDVDGVTALMRACGNGHMAVVEELLVNGAGMWCAGPTGDPKTPFMWAAHYGQLDVIRYFLEEVGLDDLAMNKGAGKSGRKTAMDYALDAGNNLGEDAKDRKAKVLAYLQEKGAEHGEGVTDPQTVFDGAARGDVNYVHFCLEANGDIISSAHGVEGSSLLHVAGNTGNVHLMQSLISHGAYVQARNALDRTPLMSAAMAGHVDALRMLLDNDATLESRDSSGDTALHHACEAGHLECVRALLSRNRPSAGVGTHEAIVVGAILDGNAPEHQPPARQLSSHELLAMKNKHGHTPVIKAFAGGVHVGVIRYVVGSIDGNVDPVKSGQVDADPPGLLTRQLSTDGIMLLPPTPVVEDPAEKKSGGLFACGEDDADHEEEQKQETVQDFDDSEDRQLFFASNGVPYPVYVPRGPPSQGHRRMTRFIDNMHSSVWGFDADKVYVISRPAVTAQSKMLAFKDAKAQNLLVPLSSIPPASTLLYVAHRWAGPGKADAADAHAQMQLNRYLSEHAGEGIHYVWLDYSCIDVADRDDVDYDQYMSNVVTALARSTHMLAVPPCKVLNPRDLMRDMAIARIAEKREALGESTEALKAAAVGITPNKPRDASMDASTDLNAPAAASVTNITHSSAPRKRGASSSGGGIGSGGGSSSSSSAVEMTRRVVAEAVDAAILSRNVSEPEKWSVLVQEIPPPPPTPATTTTPTAAETPKKKKKGAGGGGGVSAGGGGDGKIRPVPSTDNGGGASVVAGGRGSGGGSAVPPRSFTGGARSRRTSGAGSSKKALPEIPSMGSMEGGVMTRREKKAALELKTKEEAATAAAEVTHDMSQIPTILKGRILYSDPVALLSRGWVEMEVSLALIFGVEVLVCARWGPKVTFQTVLVKSVMTEDGEAEEQAPGFKGAFLHGLARVAPNVEEAKGFVVNMRTYFLGVERLADPVVPVKTVYTPMLNQCHEPQTVVAPLVRASLALHNEGVLLPFLAGDLSPVDVMYRLSGLALQDVKDGFAGLGPISDERDRVTLVRLYLLGLSYAMGVVPKGGEAVGKPRNQVMKDYLDAQRKVELLEIEVAQLRDYNKPVPVVERERLPTPPPSGGCGCVVM